MSANDAGKIAVEVMSERWLPSLHALFEAASSTCYCRYWHFTGTKNEWLDRCANRPEDSAAELDAAVRSGDPSGQGLVAIDTSAGHDKVVGWMKLTARKNLPKLRSLPVYRNLDLGSETTTFSVACMLVHPDARNQGVARAMLEAAPQIAAALGAQAVEGYPRRSPAPLYPEEAWQGPERAFLGAGFAVVHDEPPYPVYRKTR